MILRAFLLLSVFSASLFSACAAPHIAEADETAERAWNDLLATYRTEATAARALVERLRVIVPAEHLVIATIEQTAREIMQGCQQADPRDGRAVQILDRWHRVLGAQRPSLARIVRDHREAAENADFANAIRNLDEAYEATTTARDRYRSAAIAYNRALRTFPESTVNNMLLKQQPRMLPPVDQNNAAARPRER